MRIAVDAMGGDRGPGEIIAGALAALDELHDIKVLLVGDEHAIKHELGAAIPANIEIVHADQVVDMHEAPSQALRKKTKSSVAVATQLVADGKADAVLSAGNTGAAAAFALFRLGRIAGIDRPGIATVFPSAQKPVVVLDTGANVDCRPRHLVEFAVMGAVYTRGIAGIIPGTEDVKPTDELPNVGLLSIGEEETKGNELTKSAFKLLRDHSQYGSYRFYGNVEGRDIGLGTTEVVVCDGFVGNVVLKVAEGFSRMISGALREALTDGKRAQAGSLLLKPALQKFKTRVDYSGYGGAALLGVEGVCIICHGSSDARSIQSAIRIGQRVVQSDVVGSIRQAFAEHQVTNGQNGSESS